MGRSFRDSWDSSRDDHHPRLHLSSGNPSSERDGKHRRRGYDSYYSDGEDVGARGWRRYHEPKNDRRAYVESKREGRKDRGHPGRPHPLRDEGYPRRGRKRHRGEEADAYEDERSTTEFKDVGHDDDYRSSDPNRYHHRRSKDRAPHRYHARASERSGKRWADDDDNDDDDDDDVGRRPRRRRETSPGSSGQRPHREAALPRTSLEEDAHRHAPLERSHGRKDGKRTGLSAPAWRPPSYNAAVGRGQTTANDDVEAVSLGSASNATSATVSARGLHAVGEDAGREKAGQGGGYAKKREDGARQAPGRSHCALGQLTLCGVDLAVAQEHLCSIIEQLTGEVPWKVRRPAQEMAASVQRAASAKEAGAGPAEGYLDPPTASGVGDNTGGVGVLTSSETMGLTPLISGENLLIQKAATEGIWGDKQLGTAPVIPHIPQPNDYNSLIHLRGLHDVNGIGGVVVLEFAKPNVAVTAARLLNGSFINGRCITASLN